MARQRRFEITIKLSTEEQTRQSSYKLPLDAAIQSGRLTPDATAGVAEIVRNLTTGLNESGGQMSMFAELIAKHEAEAEAEKQAEKSAEKRSDDSQRLIDEIDFNPYDDDGPTPEQPHA